MKQEPNQFKVDISNIIHDGCSIKAQIETNIVDAHINIGPRPCTSDNSIWSVC